MNNLELDETDCQLSSLVLETFLICQSKPHSLVLLTSSTPFDKTIVALISILSFSSYDCFNPTKSILDTWYSGTITLCS